MGKYLIVWPKSESVTHINYHYTQFGEIVDYLNKFFPNEIVALDEDVETQNIIDFIKENDIEKIVIQVNYENIKNAFKMSESIKKDYDIPIIGYGNIPIMLPKLFLQSKFDAIHSDRDPEVSIKSFLKYYSNDKPIEQLQEELSGLRIIRDNTFIPTKEGKFISPDNWGIAKEKEVPIHEYDKVKGKNRFVLNMSRGCPFQCPHCLIQLTEGKLERRRGINNAKEAIKEIEKQYKHIKIWAANFTLDKKYVMEFCSMMESEFKDITWECATRIDLVNDKEMLNQMYRAGCRQISIGVESLNNEELIHTKDFSASDVAKAISNIQDAGIQVKGCVMLGMPNQSKESIINTFAFLKDRRVIIRPTIYTPYHHLTEYTTDINGINKYNRKTYPNNNVKGVTNAQLIQLVKDPYNYEDILSCTQGKDEKLGKVKELEI